MSITPLTLLSEFQAQLAQSGTSLSAAPTARIRALIEEESDRLQKECNRRFDERIETRYYDAVHHDRGGPLYGFNLEVDDDLKSVTALTNGDGSSISTGDIILLPRSDTPKHTLRLDSSKSVFWQLGNNDPHGAIAVTGIWGWKGEWVSVGSIVDADFDASESTVTVNDGDAFEVGMTLRVDDEYLRVTTIATDLLTVERGVNGSTAAAHDNGTGVDRWKAEPLVQNCVKRLVAWRLEQDKSPLFGQVTLGDVTFPVDVSSMPNDVQKAIVRGNLVRRVMRSV